MDFESRRQLRQVLSTAQWVAEELELAVTRQTKSGGARVGSRGSETPLVFNEKASQAAQVMHETLLEWTGWEGFTGTTSQLVGYMIESIMDFHDETMVEEIDYVVGYAMKFIDSPAVSIYLGDCACGNRLYGDPEADCLICDGCALEHKPKVLRLINQRKGFNLVVTAEQAGQYLGEVYGIPVTANRIRVWCSRKKLTPLNVKGTNLFRLGDIIDLARTMKRD